MVDKINQKLDASYQEVTTIVEEDKPVNETSEKSEEEKSPKPVRWTSLDTLGIVGFGLGIEALVCTAFGWIIIYGIIFSLISLVSSIIGLIFSKKGLNSASLKLMQLKKAGLIVNIIALVLSIIFFIISLILTILFLMNMIDYGNSAY